MDIREPRPGEILGQHYIIDSELGRGGFGVVFRARHTDIDRLVALKVLLATYGKKDPTAVERFRREATIAASLSYPNTVRVFDYGETREGVFYLVMEFVQGRDLTHAIAREGRIGLHRAVHICRQILRAMMEAHSRGIVHRDIKPDNVMLVPLGYDPDFVKVMDFGIAKMVTGGAETLTQAGLTLGTPRYMPIEQLRGEDVTPATDLYAVGLVLYEMLLGRPAFDGDSAVDCAVKVMESPSLRVPADSGVPVALARVIEKACAKHAEERYQSARELLNALDDLGLVDVEAPRSTPRPTRPPIAGGAGEAGGTAVMPDFDQPIPDGGDFEDAIETLALRTGDLDGAAGDRSASFRSAETQALAVLDDRPAAEPADRTVTTAIPTSTTPAVTPAKPQSTPTSAAGAGDRVGLGLQIATLALLVVALVKLFAG